MLELVVDLDHVTIPFVVVTMVSGVEVVSIRVAHENAQD